MDERIFEPKEADVVIGSELGRSIGSDSRQQRSVVCEE